MKPDANTRRYRDNLGDSTQAVTMVIEESAMDIVMDVMTNLYARPAEAIVREYSTNAYDSHVEAGCPERPIEVTLPTQLSPSLTIRDYGVGLDAEGIAEIYSRYGASTKRETNEQNGMLGMGCKSALAYGDQFTVVGIKNGLKTVVLVSRDEDGKGSMNILPTEPTTDEQGVSVSIPIKNEDIGELEGIAKRFYAFWKEGTVLLGYPHEDLAPPWRVGTDVDEDGNVLDLDDRSFWLDDTILLTGHDYVSQDLVVMGNVAYPLMEGEAALFDGGTGSQRRYVNGRYVYGSSYNAVVFAPIGAVNFAPSRESLRATKQTKATLERIRQRIGALRDAEVLRQVREASSAKEALALTRKGRAIGFKGTAQYKGRDVSFTIGRNVPTKRVNVARDGQPPRYEDVDSLTGYPNDWEVDNALKYSYLFFNTTTYMKKAGERSQSINLEQSEDYWLVLGFDGKNMTNTKRAKLELWWTKNGPKRSDGTTPEKLPGFIMLDQLNSDEAFWMEGWNRLNWVEVDAIKLPTNVGADGGTVRLKGSYDCYVFGDRQYETAAAKIDQTKPVYWFHGNVNQVPRHRAVKSDAIDLSTCTVVALGANRIDKFCRDFPGAIKLDDAAKLAAERWLKAQDKATIDAYSIQRRLDDDVLPNLDAGSLDDPDLRKLHAEMKRDTSAFSASINKHSAWIGVPTNEAHVKWGESVIKRYPLMTAVSAYKINKDHMVLYLNAAYQAEKGV